MSTIAERFAHVKDQIDRVAMNRPVTIIGVTKTVPAEVLQEAFDSGLRIFGENRIQEAMPKIEALASRAPVWHFIGHLQTNKAREAVRHFEMIHSVDSLKLLRQINKEAAKIHKKIDTLLEVNLGDELSKYGFSEEDLPETLNGSAGLQSVAVCGLMSIPPFFENPEDARPYFSRLRELLTKHQENFPHLQELSMGMSHDYVIAVEEGATMVRIGTAIFGERTK